MNQSKGMWSFEWSCSKVVIYFITRELCLKLASEVKGSIAGAMQTSFCICTALHYYLFLTNLNWAFVAIFFSSLHFLITKYYLSPFLLDLIEESFCMHWYIPHIQQPDGFSENVIHWYIPHIRQPDGFSENIITVQVY